MDDEHDRKREGEMNRKAAREGTNCQKELKLQKNFQIAQ